MYLCPHRAHSVCRIGAGKCMKIGDRAMVPQETRTSRWFASRETASESHICDTWNSPTMLDMIHSL
jgi:hypothetical protein